MLFLHKGLNVLGVHWTDARPGPQQINRRRRNPSCSRGVLPSCCDPDDDCAEYSDRQGDTDSYRDEMSAPHDVRSIHAAS
jgi:hypothetical protein